jgi:dTDP-4-amino-4,6-dideoxygalactose transaminase
MYKIPFNRPPYTGNEDGYVLEAMRSGKISGDGAFGLKCQAWFEQQLPCRKALLTPSCTQALEMAALLLDVQPGDEIIMPSFTFVSTANAFVLRGAKIVFVDIRPDTMNMDERLVEAAITSRTKAIVPVHYAGVGCDMRAIMSIAERHGLFVVEDAAQGMMSSIDGRALGSWGHLAAYSFHETKNFTSAGEGGLLIINDDRFLARAEIIREKGTNRSQFFRGMVDKYTWVDVGSSFLPSEIQCAYLWGQLERAEAITKSRLSTWTRYRGGLASLADAGRVELPVVPDNCVHNGHMFYLKVRDLQERTALLAHLKEDGIYAVFHYIPLHSAPAGVQHGRLEGNDRFTTKESERLLRLPLWYGLDVPMQQTVIASVRRFFGD